MVLQGTDGEFNVMILCSWGLEERKTRQNDTIWSVGRGRDNMAKWTVVTRGRDIIQCLWGLQEGDHPVQWSREEKGG